MKNPYTNIPATIWLIATVTLISRSGSMVLVFLPIYLNQQLGFDAILIGQILAFYGLGEIAGSCIGGTLSDRLGFLFIQTSGFLLVGLLYLLLAFLQSTTEIIIAIFLIGFFTAAIRPATSANIIKYSSPDNRAKSYALNYQAVNLGGTLGPAIGGLLATINYDWLFRIDGIASILAAIALISFFCRKRSNTLNTPQITPSPGLSPWHNPYFLLLIPLIFLIGFCFFLTFNAYPFFLKEIYHLSEFQIGLIIGINGLFIILFQMQLTAYLKKFTSLRVIAIGGSLIALGYFILPFYAGFWYAIFSIILITFGEMISFPLIFNHIAHIAPADKCGNYLGLLNCAIVSVPLTITPSASMYVYTHWGANMLWYGVGIIGIILWIGIEALNRKLIPPSCIASLT